MADRIAAGLHAGCADLSNAAAPATCGAAIDVPERMLNSVRRESVPSPVGPTASVQAARMLTPGAIKSGFNNSGVIPFGPLPENDATTGAGRTPTMVPRNVIVGPNPQSCRTPNPKSAPMGYTKAQLLARLQELQVEYASYDHPVVLTVEDQANYVGHLGVELSKNLFLKDKKHRFYVISALSGTNIDLKVLSQRLGLGKGGLRMAPEESLQEILQVPLGCVTPFALINESARAVSLLLDQGFKAQKCCLFHPLSNDTTISLSASDLDKFLNSIGRKPSYVDLQATPVVGKDNPPDLAALVPSEAPVLPDSTEKPVSAPQVTENHVVEEKKSTSVVNGKQKLFKANAEKPGPSVDSLAEATNVQKFVEELIGKTTVAFLAEVNKHSEHRVIEPFVLDEVKKRITADLESLTANLKNAAFTQGFSSGLQTTKLQLDSIFGCRS